MRTDKKLATRFSVGAARLWVRDWISNGNINKQVVFSSKMMKINWKQVASASLTSKEIIFISKSTYSH